MSSVNEDRFYSEFGNRVQRARRKLKLTQEALASLVGLTRTSIVNIEKGRQKVLCHTLVALSRSLKVKCEDLLPIPSDGVELEDLLRVAPADAQAFVRSAVESSERKR